LTEEEISDTFLVAVVAAFTLAILVPLGIGLLIVGYAALKGMKWACKALLIVCSISVAVSIVTATFGKRSSFGGILVNSFIVAYLSTNQAKTYFGRIRPELKPQSSPSGTDTLI